MSKITLCFACLDIRASVLNGGGPKYLPVFSAGAKNDAAIVGTSGRN